ncbi:MAG: hypothetical protein IIA59_06505 [Candidatus Marinimicrobia bacterium]|nr:hypothetical protein [Candidatus Neomarinimicrobiota bacterium]
MKHQHNLVVILGCLLALGGTTARAQSAQQEPVEYLVTTIRIAPGQHLAFLKWMAEQEVVAKEAGAPATQWYAHLDGASWDYISITEELGAAKQAKIDEKIEKLSKKKKMATGMRVALEFRQFISSHTDTYVLGPFTAAELVKEAE